MCPTTYTITAEEILIPLTKICAACDEVVDAFVKEGLIKPLGVSLDSNRDKFAKEILLSTQCVLGILQASQGKYKSACKNERNLMDGIFRDL